MGLTESFDSFVQRLQCTVNGSAGISKNLGKRLYCGDGSGAIGDGIGCIKTGMSGDNCGSRRMGSLDSRDNGGKGIQGSLDG
jgi:hypothetical protein